MPPTRNRCHIWQHSQTMSLQLWPLHSHWASSVGQVCQLVVTVENTVLTVEDVLRLQLQLYLQLQLWWQLDWISLFYTTCRCTELWWQLHGLITSFVSHQLCAHQVWKDVSGEIKAAVTLSLHLLIFWRVCKREGFTTWNYVPPLVQKVLKISSRVSKSHCMRWARWHPKKAFDCKYLSARFWVAHVY